MKKFLSVLLAVTLCSFAFIGCNKDNTSETEQEKTQQEQEGQDMNTPNVKLIQFEKPTEDSVIATMDTSMGKIEIMLFPEETPLAVENFVKHSVDGYYDGLKFHRVMDNFMIQGGDPLGTGIGGESIYKDEQGNPVPFKDEFSENLFNFRGALSMANSGPSTNGSQFFIVQSPTICGGYKADDLKKARFPENAADKYGEVGGTPHLDGHHTVFGQVIKGMDVVDSIAKVKTNSNDKPDTDVIINSITIKNNPYTK